ncbi:hypothetical protein AX774_g54 [Zancudomyces culisetae]|uniref:Uncharacterized protein n=1 Tax=Zancudomyces culisetae TaxID=1213189 RepID=A0A1R1PZI3_ZANCU|nr:hypothetical protein AX774_g54 [Zancudomyces culisetae]|eukprot:OMH86368.1 hypothetical protein AX774_g54 [Zancudomyces culisetae]
MDVGIHNAFRYNYYFAIENKIDNKHNSKNVEAQIIGEMFAVYTSQFNMDDEVKLDELEKKQYTGFQVIYLNNEKPVHSLSDFVAGFTLFYGESDLITNPGARNYTYYIIELLRRVILYDSNAYMICIGISDPLKIVDYNQKVDTTNPLGC